jgi:hypothetical protein
MKVMSDYRAYLLDRAGRIIGPPEVISCHGDAAAIERAKQLVDEHDVELWLCDLRIARFEKTMQ